MLSNENVLQLPATKRCVYHSHPFFFILFHDRKGSIPLTLLPFQGILIDNQFVYIRRVSLYYEVMVNGAKGP